MKILVLDPAVAERDTTLRLFVASRHSVTAVAAIDKAAILRACVQGQVDVLVVEQEPSGLALLRELRSQETHGHVFVVVTAARRRPGDIDEAFGAGADDFVRKPIARDELLARVEGPNRIRAWSRGLTAADGQLVVGDPSTLAAWRTLESTVDADLGAMVGQDFVAAEMEAPLTPPLYAQIPLHLTGEQLQLTLRVGAERPDQIALATELLSSPLADEVAIRDLLREIANLAAGAFKRTAAAEGRVFSLGIPVDVRQSIHPAEPPCARREWMARAANGLTVRFRAELRMASNKLLRANALREGMVLVHDLINPAGAMLLPKATCLTESHLVHLHKALGTTMLVEVAHDAM